MLVLIVRLRSTTGYKLLLSHIYHKAFFLIDDKVPAASIIRFYILRRSYTSYTDYDVFMESGNIVTDTLTSYGTVVMATTQAVSTAPTKRESFRS